MKPLEETEYARLPWGEFMVPVDMLPELIRRARRVNVDYDGNVTEAKVITDVKIVPSEQCVAFNVANALTQPKTNNKR